MFAEHSDIGSGMKGLLPVSAEFLLSTADSRDYWRTLRCSSPHEALIREIIEEGERLLLEPVPESSYSLFKLFEENGNRLAFEKVYFDRRRRLTTFGLLTLLEPENEQYRDALQDIIWSVCNEYSWCLPAHLRGSLETDGSFDSGDESVWGRKQRRTHIDLFAAETGFTLSELLNLAGESLPPLLRSRIQEEVSLRLFRPYLQHGPYHWEDAEHNWAAVCAGSIGAAALLLLEEGEKLTEIISKALGSMECYLKGFGEDGACQEGIGYWNYGFGYFTYFADLLQKRTSGRVNLFDQGKVHQIALFQQKSYLTGDLTVNFSDSSQYTRVHLGLSHYLSQLYPDVAPAPAELRAPFTEDHCARFAPALRNLIWAQPAQEVPHGGRLTIISIMLSGLYPGT
ncbi:hypothetical protein [Paenibacillus hexagrammi]|uniref:Heparinase II/III-like protein n=1 Tax=Paenibacillus hexagrammi TaxID=2908839 RepID=A0ABY3SN16_9BACL|nr:hypothetical protein [Paenibacillus sp. YPD9-1]UJF34362.1 hypothetical protein L0M14_03900 [Paenibacillus sp. YPD9-1]